ncbi:hypothetical protein DFH09DRAFT_1357376 [Mycena vulgaris]|nr:hypothetical protein DFH09DRAFT_1357376 [Mycena vulgaris]
MPLRSVYPAAVAQWHQSPNDGLALQLPEAVSGSETRIADGQGGVYGWQGGEGNAYCVLLPGCKCSGTTARSMWREIYCGVLDTYVSGLSHHCAPSSPSISPSRRPPAACRAASPPSHVRVSPFSSAEPRCRCTSPRCSAARSWVRRRRP